jgi:hypothetical protein
MQDRNLIVEYPVSGAHKYERGGYRHKTTVFLVSLAHVSTQTGHQVIHEEYIVIQTSITKQKPLNRQQYNARC